MFPPLAKCNLGSSDSVKRTDQPYTTYALEYGLHNHVQGWLVDDTTIGGCSRVAGPFFSLPQHHRRLFKGCWPFLFTCPQQPSAAVWRRSKVQPWGAALHRGTKCNCLGAADGRPSLDEQMEICGKTYVPNIYIYIYIYIYLHISGRKYGFGVIRGLASLAPNNI